MNIAIAFTFLFLSFPSLTIFVTSMGLSESFSKLSEGSNSLVVLTFL
jgi:hypothetical protein